MTGPLGAIWFFKKRSAREDWGIRLSVRSLPLAIYGLKVVHREIESTLALLTGNAPPPPMSISRVDYALDYFVPEFELVADHFVMHSRFKRQLDGSLSEVGRSSKTTSVRIGKMPGQQVAVYDKRADVIAKGKRIWWEL